MEGVKKVFGNRVYLEVPKKEETKIIVDHNTQEDLKKELAKKMQKLKVLALGVSITDSNLEVGDMVLVDPQALSRANIIPIGDVDIISVSYFDILHAWE